MTTEALVYMEEAEGFRVDATAHERALARDGIPNPSYRELLTALASHGPDGILESGCHLPPDEFKQLHALVNEARKNPKYTDKPRKRRRRR